jgi:anti-anti-sigma factor
MDEKRRDGELTVRNSFAGATYRVTLGGELNRLNVACLVEELSRMEESGAAETIVDLSGLNFIDSGGMAALAEASNHFHSNDQSLKFLGTPTLFTQVRAGASAA